MVPLWRDLDSGKTKNTDQQVALSIGAIGGVPTRDKRGNVLDALWVKYSERSVVGMLLETNDIRKILLEQIQEQLKARRDLIQEVEQNDIVCQWLMAFTKSWETEYSAQIISRFDIGQLVLSVMNEAYFEVPPCRCFVACYCLSLSGGSILTPAQVLVLFSHSPCIQKYCGRNGTQRFFVECVKKAEAHFNNMRGVAARETVLAETRKKEIEAKLQDAIRALSPDHRNTDPVKTALKKVAEVDTANSQREIKERAGLLLVDVHTGDDAVVRLLFRHPNTRSVMCRIAGAILRKQVRLRLSQTPRRAAVCADHARAGGLQPRRRLLCQGPAQRHLTEKGSCARHLLRLGPGRQRWHRRAQALAQYPQGARPLDHRPQGRGRRN